MSSPMVSTFQPGTVGVRMAWGMTGYSAQSWADSVLGDDRILTILSDGTPLPAPPPGKVVFGLVPKSYGFE